jgi:hypothetical protein
MTGRDGFVKHANKFPGWNAGFQSTFVGKREDADWKSAIQGIHSLGPRGLDLVD